MVGDSPRTRGGERGGRDPVRAKQDLGGPAEKACGTPAHTLRCGLERSQEHGEERLDDRDRVYRADHRPAGRLLHAGVCVMFVCACGVFGWQRLACPFCHAKGKY